MHISADKSHIGSCYGTGTSKEEDRANATRIVACVNACKNVPNEWLQSNAVYAVIEERDRLKRERDNLMQAMESIAEMTPATHAGANGCFFLAKKTALDVLMKLKTIKP
jgi:hypothetical protein